MYKVKFTEKLEDWYVVESEDETYESIDLAIENFNKTAIDIINDSSSSQGISLYIEDYHSKDDLESYSAGILIELIRNRDVIASIFLEYDFRSKRIRVGSDPEIDHDNLEEEEQAPLQKLINFFKKY
jgi:hypothetical protein